ncbi:hypothetical protein Q7P37_006932 [Cladosporium fusiforme]
MNACGIRITWSPLFEDALNHSNSHLHLTPTTTSTVDTRATSATMATSSSIAAKRRQKNSITPTVPLRRSVRIIMRETFRFNDLPSELRDMVYTCALQQDTEADGYLLLSQGMTTTAIAISQVSRKVHTESMAIFYSQNTFEVRVNYFHVGRPPNLDADVFQTFGTADRRLARWAKTLCELAAPHIRLLVVSASPYFLSHHCSKRIFLDLKNARAREETISTGAMPCCSFLDLFRAADLRARVESVLRKHDSLALDAQHLNMLLRGLGTATGGFSDRSEGDRNTVVEKGLLPGNAWCGSSKV